MTFKVLQMALYSRIFKTFDYYMKNFIYENMYYHNVNYALQATKVYIYLTFKVLQTVLYSRIFKTFVSYMENFIKYLTSDVHI